MKKIAILNTSINSYNMGDYIIVESAKKQLNDITKDSFVIDMPTHTPAFHTYEMLSKNKRKRVLDFKEKFVCGTNILNNDMLFHRPVWNINLPESLFLKDCILMAAGCGKMTGKTNLYTKLVLSNVLSKNYIHSTRDEKAKKFLESLGFKAINTGCCTMWDLTPEHCSNIPTIKKDRVVFTLTDYCKDIERDQKLIDILNKNYEEVYFWIQGSNDLEYFSKFKNIENIKLINPQLKYYNDFLEKNDCDYVGTRLHAGIKAMQKFKRSIIIVVDNRARSIQEDYNINCIERNKIDELDGMINSEIKTSLKIDFDAIEQWKKQFK